MVFTSFFVFTSLSPLFSMESWLVLSLSLEFSFIEVELEKVLDEFPQLLSSLVEASPFK